MAHDELIRALVMDSIANDYEDLPTVLSSVHGWLKEEGKTPSDADVVDALLMLIREGLARAYRPTGRTGLIEINGVPSEDDIPTAWFYLTDLGKEQVER